MTDINQKYVTFNGFPLNILNLLNVIKESLKTLIQDIIHKRIKY